MTPSYDGLTPPTEAEVKHAIAMFAERLQAAYGARLAGIYLFGSRARQDHEPFSDADIAVVLRDDEWSLIPEKRRLARLAYDAIVETGVHVQGWPISASAWNNPKSHNDPALVENMRREAVPIGALL